MSEPSDQGNEAGGPKRVSLFGRRDKAPAAPPARPAAPPPEAPRKRRRSGLSMLSGFLTFALIATVIALGGFGWAKYEVERPGPLEADKIVALVREEDGGTLAQQLERAGVIDSALSFTVMTWFHTTMNWIQGSHSTLKRAEYRFKQHASLTDVEQVLTSGKPVQHPLTIPEGLTSEQVTQRVRDAEFLAGDVKDKDIPREGSILPETLDFERGNMKMSALARFVKEQTKVVDEIWNKRAPDLPFKSPGELVTLASIVEKETGKPDERPRVAGVFINRLQKRMKLQSDPTIVYGLVKGKGTLGHSISKAELEQRTDYNTYIIDGLPPGPICNPGKAALEAAANPMRTKELYFVADGTGGHAFAETLDQHQKNVLRWRQLQQDAKDRLAPDATPAPPGAPGAPTSTHGALEPLDSRIFGALAAPSPPAARNSALGSRLAKLGAERQASRALLGPNGLLSNAGKGARSLEDIGAVVQGVNDVPADDLTALADDPGPSGSPVTTYPLSPAALADQRARAARYGLPSAAAANDQAAPANPPASAVAAIDQKAARPHAFDASEGTSLDPLLNQTYDLNYAKVVPKLQ